MTLPLPVYHVLLTLSLLTNLTLAPIMETQECHPVGHEVITPILPPEDFWQPDPNDITLIAQTVWGEARGCSQVEQEAVVWCILNRVDDSRFPNTIEGVITAKGQFAGYSPNFPSDTFHDLAEDVLMRWHNGEHGIPTDLVFFRSDGHGHNTFYSECFGGHDYTYNDMTKGE